MSAESFHLSSDIICPETFNDVVQELGSDGNDLLAAVQEDETVFCGKSRRKLVSKMNSKNHKENIPSYPLYPIHYGNRKDANRIIVKNEPQEYAQEDQKNFISTWNGGVQHYDYNEPTVMYPPPPPLQHTLAQIPANVDYAGDLDFDILISSHTANRNSWIYSSTLKKVFINMQNVLPVDVKRNPANIDLYLRATLLYSLPQYTQEIVERCSTHVDPRMSTNRDIDHSVMKHVLRCSNQGSVYFGNTDMKEHLSVVTPLGLPQAGMDTVRVNYQFMCKNSCPSGMNRRAVDVIFTLEDRCANVLGRRKLAVRVCSCPKRDKEKEEKEFRESNTTPPAYTRKRKMSHLKHRLEHPAVPINDDAIYEIPSFKVMSRQTAETVLKIARDRAFFDLSTGCLEETKLEKARECYEEINNIIKNLTPKEEI